MLCSALIYSVFYVLLCSPLHSFKVSKQLQTFLLCEKFLKKTFEKLTTLLDDLVLLCLKIIFRKKVEEIYFLGCVSCVNFVWCLSCAVVGVSRNCCSEVYNGVRALSESEAVAVTDFLGSGTDFLCFLTIHSYGQLILVPYGHPNISAPNYPELVRPDASEYWEISRDSDTWFRLSRLFQKVKPTCGSIFYWDGDNSVVEHLTTHNRLKSSLYLALDKSSC